MRILLAGSSADNARLPRIGTYNLVRAPEETPIDLQAESPRSATIGGVRSLEDPSAEADEHVVLRLGTLYGSETWYRAFGAVAEQMGNGQLPADEAVASFLHVQDATSATLQALQWPSGPVNIVDTTRLPQRGGCRRSPAGTRHRYPR